MRFNEDPPQGTKLGFERWRTIVGMGTIVTLALVLRIIRLSYQPLWWDEGWSVYFATSRVGAILELTSVDIHPPLYYLLLHLWTSLAGPSPLAVRSFSVVVGTATVPLIYVTGRRLHNPAVGWLAALLLALSPLHIYYSQEVRMYGLVTLLGLASLYCTLHFLERPSGHYEPSLAHTRRDLVPWLGYVAAASAALYTQYYAAFLLLGLNLFVVIHALRARRKAPHGDTVPVPRLISWLGAQFAVVVLYVPWLWYAGRRLLTYVQFKVGVEQDPMLGPLTYLVRHLAAFGWGHAEGALSAWWWVGLLPASLLLLVLLWVTLRRHMTWRGIGAAWPAFLLTTVLVCGFAVHVVFPFAPPRLERLLLLALPMYVLAYAAPLARLWHGHRPWAGLVLASLFLCTGISLAFFYAVARYPDDDYRPIAANISALAQPTDAVLCIHPWQVGYFEAYLPNDQAQPSLVLTPREVLPRERQIWADNQENMATDVDALLSEHTDIWLPAHQTMGRILEDQLEAYLVTHAYPVSRQWYGENTVLVQVASEPDYALSTLPLTAQFGNWLQLSRVAMDTQPKPSAWGTIRVDLDWQIDSLPDSPHHVGLRLSDTSGRVWAQRDSLPQGGTGGFDQSPLGESGTRSNRLHDRHGLRVPAGTPPGEYLVTLRVYQSQDVTVVPVAFEGGSGGELRLGTVRITRPQVAPPVEALDYEQPLQADFEDSLRLLGVTLLTTEAKLPGEFVNVDLYWRARKAPGADLFPRLQLLDSAGAVAAELVEKPVGGSYPTAWWQPGELVRDPHALPIAAGVSQGTYDLVLSLLPASMDQPVPISGKGDAFLTLGSVQVVSRPHTLTPPSPAYRQTTRLDDRVELTGYDLQTGPYTPGGALGVTLYWHAIETPDRAYHVFVHLLDAGERTVAQHDGPPGEGQLPALGWLPGEYLVDNHTLSLPIDLPAGEYRLEVGLYDPTTGVRLGDRILLDTTIVVAYE